MLSPYSIGSNVHTHSMAHFESIQMQRGSKQSPPSWFGFFLRGQLFWCVLLLDVFLLLLCPCFMVNSKSLCCWSPHQCLDNTHTFLITPRLKCRTTLVRTDPHILVAKQCVGTHSDHETNGAADDNDNGVRRRIRKPLFVEIVLILNLNEIKMKQWQTNNKKMSI